MMKERRRDLRTPLDRPIKLQSALSGRYCAGRTRNLSHGGALLQIDHPSLLTNGQHVNLGIGQSDHQAILHADQMMDATVRRCLALEGKQHVAIQFDQRQQQLAAAG